MTSAYHIYRTKRLFEKQGFEVTPYLVDYKASRNNTIMLMDFLPSAGNLAVSETGIREIIGLLFYSFRS